MNMTAFINLRNSEDPEGQGCWAELMISAEQDGGPTRWNVGKRSQVRKLGAPAVMPMISGTQAAALSMHRLSTR